MGMPPKTFRRQPRIPSLHRCRPRSASCGSGDQPDAVKSAQAGVINVRDLEDAANAGEVIERGGPPAAVESLGELQTILQTCGSCEADEGLRAAESKAGNLDQELAVVEEA